MTKKNIFVSVRTRLVIALVVSLLIGGAIFAVVREVGDFVAWKYYFKATTAQQREEGYVRELQNYVLEHKISTDEVGRVIGWASGKPVDVYVYKDDDLIYRPDWFTGFDPSAIPGVFIESEFYREWFSGDRSFEQYLTEEARTKYNHTLNAILEGNKELVPLYCVDGTLLITLSDYSEITANNIITAISLIIALAVFATIMIFCFRNMARRVNKLAREVRLVGAGNLDAPIKMKGNDDITWLAQDINLMRSSMVDNMTKEREAWEANSALITAMSHDIRTPLTVLMGYLDLIELSDGDEVNAEYLEICRENAQRLKKLSDDMFSYFLVFGKNDLGLKTESVKASAEISNMIAEHAVLLSEKGYNIVCSDMPDACVRIDVAYFHRIIDNVFSNIAKYADKEREVTVTAEAQGECFTLTFENAIRKDKAIPESNRIGLKTCSKIIENMGGELVIEETEDRFSIKVKLGTEAQNDNS